jgi:3-mercaptopyruvate sulfurtransferase SseA
MSSAATSVPALVDGAWVRSHIVQGQGFKVVDCSWFLLPPSSPHRPAIQGISLPPRQFYPCPFIHENQPGAVHFDVDEVADKSEDKSPSPHMLPSPQQFAAWMDRHGITKSPPPFFCVQLLRTTLTRGNCE